MEMDQTVHGIGTGYCSLHRKQCKGLTVTFADGTVTNKFLSWKAYQQLLAMKMGEPADAEPVANVIADNHEGVPS